jgi:hypothetical protein
MPLNGAQRRRPALPPGSPIVTLDSVPTGGPTPATSQGHGARAASTASLHSGGSSPNSGELSIPRPAEGSFQRCLSATYGSRLRGSTQDCLRNSRLWVITSAREDLNSDCCSARSQTCSGRIRNQSTHGSATTANPHYACFQRLGPFSDMIWRTCRATRRSDSGSLPNAEDWDFRRKRSPGVSGSTRGRLEDPRGKVYASSACEFSESLSDG